MTERVAHLGDVLPAVLRAYGMNDARTVQSQEGRLGPSDAGWCRMKAALMTKGVPQSDVKPIGKAQRGTAAHHYLGKAISWGRPGWMVDTPDNPLGRVTATLPSGIEISGTPDAVDPIDNGVIDFKTKEALELVRRLGVDQAHRYQRHLYALGAIAKGWLDPTRPIYVANWYLDPNDYGNSVWLAEEFDESLTYEIDEWLVAVRDAVLNDNLDDELRDIDAPICFAICEYATACRGGALPARDGIEIFQDEWLTEAAVMYDEGRSMAKTGGMFMDQAKKVLAGYNGIARTKDDEFLQVRWVNKAGTPDRAASTSINVHKIRMPNA